MFDYKISDYEEGREDSEANEVGEQASNSGETRADEFVNEQTKKLKELAPSLKKLKGLVPKKKRKPLPHAFKKGNKLGKKFGQGQVAVNPTGVRKPEKTVLEEMRRNAEAWGLGIYEIGEAMMKISLDESIDCRFRFPFMKEIVMRVYGQPKNSVDEALKYITQRVDKLYELTMPLLEATAIGDGVKLVRELVDQGKLEDVLRRIDEERGNG